MTEERTAPRDAFGDSAPRRAEPGEVRTTAVVDGGARRL